MTSPGDRQKALQILDEGIADGARARAVADLHGVGLTTLQRWRRQFAGNALHQAKGLRTRDSPASEQVGRRRQAGAGV
ncbi:helix-turn-helix domain-containing protein [Cyanobium sp. HWJ4-Hawea]|uniref:helix-turn-helix domain-containing protein n=1 Tax=Cyanobium sp. HWJ4-Hawea TaxID=2823713 RepID=UPI0028F40411|nr:helix-turn-helix domain-containing protein [Cyanobium sp. HWJ4-Hawea]